MEESKLPAGWRLAKLGEIVKIGSRNVDPSSEPDRMWNYVALENVEPGSGRLVDFALTLGKEIGSTKARFQEGDVLYGKLRPYLRKAWVAEFDGCSSTDLIPLTPGDCILAEYLKWFLLSPLHMEYIMPLMAGIRMPRLRSDDLFNMPIPLPPIDEQRRIVTRVEEMMERSRRARGAASEAVQLHTMGERSIVASVFSGQALGTTSGVPDEPLNLEPSSGPRSPLDGKRAQSKVPDVLERFHGRPIRIPSAWRWGKVRDVAECLDSCRVPLSRAVRAGRKGQIPYYGANGVVDYINDFIFDEPLVLVTEDETFYGRTKPIAWRVDGQAWVNNHAHVLRPLHGFPIDLLCLYLMYYPVEPWLSGTTGRAKLTQGVLMELPVPIPPSERWSELAQWGTEALAALRQSHSKCKAVLAQLDELEQEILRTAFAPPY